MTKKERRKLDKYYSKYGITYAQYEEKLRSQQDKCDLCDGHKSRSKRRLHVDHDHKSGKVRGIVCMYCNRKRIGQLTLEWARKIVHYLEKHQ